LSIEIIFLRHAETLKEKEVPISKWSLSLEGYMQTKQTRTILRSEHFDFIISSAEKKAFETAKAFEDMINSRIVRNPLFNELNRDNGPYLSNEEYLKAVQCIMEDSSLSIHGWETIESAMKRFNQGVEELNIQYQSKKLLVVSHGIVLTMHFASLLNCMKIAFDRWKRLKFCDYGIIKNGKVIKDIINW
jgi:broad specificity phosphatase PhoE